MKILNFSKILLFPNYTICLIFQKMVTNPFSPCWGKCIKIFLIYAIVLLLVPLQLQRLSLWQAIEPLAEVVKFGTQIKDSMNINHSKFGVSDSNSLAPPSAQICTHVYAFKSQGLKTWFLHFQTRTRQFVELSLKLAWIIFRPCWVNVINVDRSNQSFIIQNLMPKYIWGCSFAKLWHIDSKPCVSLSPNTNPTSSSVISNYDQIFIYGF